MTIRAVTAAFAFRYNQVDTMTRYEAIVVHFMSQFDGIHVQYTAAISVFFLFFSFFIDHAFYFKLDRWSVEMYHELTTGVHTHFSMVPTGPRVVDPAE